jgi:predicted HTH domain antitoxin
MEFSITQDAYEKYLEKKDTISNSRLRPEGETFLDALMSVDMTATPELSLEQSADFCGVTIYQFLSILSEAGVPVIDYDPDELEQEIAI